MIYPWCPPPSQPWTRPSEIWMILESPAANDIGELSTDLSSLDEAFDGLDQAFEGIDGDPTGDREYPSHGHHLH